MVFDVILIVLLIGCSAYFSGTETAIMSSNRYRLQFLVKQFENAKLVISYLKSPERFLGVVLVGNNIANIAVSSLVTVLTIHYFGDLFVPVSTLILSVVILVFAEVLPKTIATLHPERFAIKSVVIIRFLETILSPVVSVIHWVSKMCTPKQLSKNRTEHRLGKEEIRQMVDVDSNDLTDQDQKMLLGLLDLDQINVNDIMIPKKDFEGIDISWGWGKIQWFLSHSNHSQHIVYRNDLDDILGVIFVSDVIKLLNKGGFNKNSLIFSLKPIQYVPERTNVLKQINNFKNNHEVFWSIVVDEYGEVSGVISIHDIVEEVVGHYRDNSPMQSGQIFRKGLGYLLDAKLSIRDVNRLLDFFLPVSGPSTISGMILEYLEAIPQGRVSMMISGYYIEVLEVDENRIKKVYIEKRGLPS